LVIRSNNAEVREQKEEGPCKVVPIIPDGSDGEQ